MPLAFPSRSHDVVAFGFFNIASDMLLLEDLFFFAEDFCEAVARLAEARADGAEYGIDGWRISDRAQAGNLHGAIAGRDLSGFIGATYAAWPFPRDPAGFKQDPEGSRTRPEVREMIARFAEPTSIPVRCEAEGLSFSVAEYVFDRPAFEMLAGYVEQGG
jgi:hypothetical protein